MDPRLTSYSWVVEENGREIEYVSDTEYYESLEEDDFESSKESSEDTE